MNLKSWINKNLETIPPSKTFMILWSIVGPITGIYHRLKICTPFFTLKIKLLHLLSKDDNHQNSVKKVVDQMQKEIKDNRQKLIKKYGKLPKIYDNKTRIL